jgi:hypothetical protein
MTVGFYGGMAAPLPSIITKTASPHWPLRSFFHVGDEYCPHHSSTTTAAANGEYTAHQGIFQWSDAA